MYTPKGYRGFKSLLLRQKNPILSDGVLFFDKEGFELINSLLLAVNNKPAYMMATRISVFSGGGHRTGDRVNVGVAVLFADKDRPHSLRVLMPSGKEYVMQKIKTDPGMEEASPKGGVPSPTGSVSNKKVSPAGPNPKSAAGAAYEGNSLAITVAQPDAEVKSESAEADAPLLYSVRFDEDKYFSRQIDKLGELKEGSYVTVGKILRGSPIEKVGIPAGNLYFDVSKIRQEMLERGDPIPPETIKEIPKVLDNPMVITEYFDKSGKPSINVYGKLYVGSSPVVIGIMIGKHRNGQSVDKIQTVHPNRHFLAEVTADKTLYLGENKKETNAWFQALGAQEPPLGGTKYGFIRMLSQPKPVVNTDSTRKSERGEDSSNRSLLANAFEGITKSSPEYKMIQEYKGHVKDLNALEKKLLLVATCKNFKNPGFVWNPGFFIHFRAIR